MAAKKKKRLRSQLGLFDVFVLSTGAMISSGFFLLPGLAAAQAGPAVVLAYLFAGILVLPAMFSQAELATAMPRAGGAYYFLDRSLGPIVGLVAGLGTWLALVLKTAFALIGMGAYLSLFMDLPITAVAIGLTLLFTGVNLVGAKQTSGLQGTLVVTLLLVLVFFIAQGVAKIFGPGIEEPLAQFSPFLPFGTAGLISTVGFVFVSYAGLTKIASVAEEVQNPDRNIPLGMGLSLLVATFVYVAGVFIMVAALDPVELRQDLTPVATAAESFFDWLPGQIGLILVTVAAVAAFASTGNAGILSASRYPLAMARDGFLWRGFQRLGRFHTPSPAIFLTSGALVVVLLTLDVEKVAKLASSVQLLLFALLNLAVVVMRESRIQGYEPGYRSPLYPWMQIAGILIPIWLIVELGWFPFLFTLGVVFVGVAWYRYRGLHDLPREGAIYHVFERLGQSRYSGLDRELQQIVEEKEFLKVDPFEEVVRTAPAFTEAEGESLEGITEHLVEAVEAQGEVSGEELRAGLRKTTRPWAVPIAHGAVFLHLRTDRVKVPRLAMARSEAGVPADFGGEALAPDRSVGPLHAAFLLVSPSHEPGQHLRVLGRLAARVDEGDFLETWLEARDADGLKQALLRHEHSVAVPVKGEGPSAELIDKRVQDLDLPEGVLIGLIRRQGRNVIPRGSTQLHLGDRLMLIGDPDAIDDLFQRYVAAPAGAATEAGPREPEAQDPEPREPEAQDPEPRDPEAPPRDEPPA